MSVCVHFLTFRLTDTKWTQSLTNNCEKKGWKLSEWLLDYQVYQCFYFNKTIPFLYESWFTFGSDAFEFEWSVWLGPVLPWCTKRFIWMRNMSLDAARCLGFLANAQVVPRCTKKFIWMLKMNFDTAGCLGYQYIICTLMHQEIYMWLLKMSLNAAGSFGCLLMHNLCHDAPREFFKDDPWCLSVVPRWNKRFRWMLKMTLDAGGCLGYLLDAPPPLIGLRKKQHK